MLFPNTLRSVGSDTVVRVLRVAVDNETWQELAEAERRAVSWGFLRHSAFPEPSASETPAEWSERLKIALSDYLDKRNLQMNTSFSGFSSKHNIPTTGTAKMFLSFERPDIRTTVIHQVKGETIRAVLLIANEAQHTIWLDVDQCSEEESNVCYVALSRAADLLLLQCPTSSIATLWTNHGFRKL